MRTGIRGLATALVAICLLASGLGALPAEAQEATAEGATIQGIERRDRLIFSQESLLNAYRCMFGIDTQIVPGGCADGAPARPDPQPAPFAGTPSAADVEVRDRLVASQESLLNAYRCMFGIDTQTVPGGCPGSSEDPTHSDAPTEAWVAGVNAAGWGFHRHLDGNSVSSPISIGMAFSLSRAGASSESGATLDRIFGFPETGSHRAANAVDLQLAEASAVPTTLEVANRLFPDNEFSPRRDFLNTATAHYGATIQPVDTSDGAAAADIINGWVSERTRGLIPRIVDPGVVQGQELVLVNTVYLKADWRTPFLAEFTSQRQFTTGGGQTVMAPFMHDRVPIQRRFARMEGADAVELPYQGRELAMWLIVPHEVDGLAAVEESLDAAALVGLGSAAQEGSVSITMPKWEQTLPPADLFEWLCPLRFCPGAGFEGIAPGIFISAALHGAKVIVDEKGTEAAASTATAFPTSMPPEPDLTVVADRPFLWAIVHQDTGAILFVGRLLNPAQ